MSSRPPIKASIPARLPSITRHRALCGWLLGAVATLAPCTARADAADARDLFARGRELRVHGDCASALPLFREAYEIYPAGLGSLRNVAECQESLGHFASARTAWFDLNRALQQNTEPRYAGWSQDAERAATRLASKVATLTIDIVGMSPRSDRAAAIGLEVTVNGEPIPPGLLGTPLDRDPGRYLVRVRVFGAGIEAVRGAVYEQSLELSAGKAEHAIIDVAPAPASSTSTAAGDKARRVTAWVAIGVGASGLVGAAVSALVRQSEIGKLHDEGCDDENGRIVCDPSGRSMVQETANRGELASTLVNVFATVGVVGLASGLVLLATNPSRSSASAALLVSPSGVSAVGRF